MNIPTFEYDSAKNRSNLEKHGISLDEAQNLWLGPHVIVPALYLRREKRFFILGFIEEKLWVAVFVWRRDIVRLISCHRADRRFYRIFEEKIHEKNKD